MTIYCRHCGSSKFRTSRFRFQALDLAQLLADRLEQAQRLVARAIDAVNEGAIFRFMTKPCSRVMMAVTLKACVEQHELITGQRILLEQTLHGAIKALTDVLGLTNPLAFGRATRLRRGVRNVALVADIANGWQLEVAAMLSQIGSVILPPAVLEKMHAGESLTDEEEGMVRRAPEMVEQILSNIPRLEAVREILRYQDKHYDGSGAPNGAAGGEAIPWGGRALKLVLDLDQLESEGTSLEKAFDVLRGRTGWYDPGIQEVLAKVRGAQESSEVRELPVTSLRAGMIFAQDVRNRKGHLFVARGQEVTRGLVEKLKLFAPDLLGGAWIRVIVEDPVYAGLKNLLTGMGAHLIGVPVGAEGIQIAQFEHVNTLQ